MLESGKNTLAAALKFMNDLPLSRLRIDESVLSNYISHKDLGFLSWVEAINTELDEIEQS